MENGYEKWWDIRFPLVASRESTDPSNIADLPFYKDNQNTDPEDDLGGRNNVTADSKDKCTSRKIKKQLDSVY